MTRHDTPLCPLLSVGQLEPVPCAAELCAWWDGPTGFCSVFTATESIKDAAEQINAMNIILEGKEDNDNG